MHVARQTSFPMPYAYAFRLMPFRTYTPESLVTLAVFFTFFHPFFVIIVVVVVFFCLAVL